MKVVLVHPQIPQNTGNIVRTCKVTNTGLALVHPLGFSTKDRDLKRAGLDYWEGVAVEEIESLENYLKSFSSFYFFSSKAKKVYSEVSYHEHSLLIFGSETSGIPDWVWEKWPDRFVTIPMMDESRCLNLSNSVAVGLYEGLRQLGFYSPFKKREYTCKE